jgi:hypothetical protein
MQHFMTPLHNTLISMAVRFSFGLTERAKQKNFWFARFYFASKLFKSERVNVRIEFT